MADTDTEVVQVHEAEVCFREMLRRANVNDAAPDAEKIWSVFQDFSRLPVSEPTVLLFTSECDNQGEAPGSRLYFERQMSVYNGSEYHHTEHLTCMLYFPLNRMPSPLEDAELVFEVGSDGQIEDFFTEVEGTHSFQVLMYHFQPQKLLVSQGKV